MKICYNCFNEIPDSTKTCPRCGRSADLWNGDRYTYALPCGSVLNGKYIVGRVLGQGGFGITYVGQQYDTKQLVAIKEYYPGAIATRNASHSVFPFSKDRRGDYEYGKKQFLDEAKTLSAFIGSPNIVRIFGYFEENGTAYFVMEYVDGKSLRQYIADRGGRISWEEIWSFLMPVLDALSEVHYRNIIHRDIKPDNIIITKSGSAKLIDFGAARYNQGEKSKSLTAVLTPGYAPLEQYFTRGRQGPWTDVYALAATIYYCITGTVPIESVERSVYDDLKKPSELGVSIPDYAEAALMKALAVKEQDRFKSTYDFRNALLEKKSGKEIEGTGTDSGRSGAERGRSGTGSSSENKSESFNYLENNFRKTLELAVQGDSDAQYLLGYFYESGKGVQKSGELAIKWYRRASAQGNPAAKTRLSLLSEEDPVKESGESGSKIEPQHGGRNAGDGTREESGNAVSGGGQQLRGNSEADGKQKSLGNSCADGGQQSLGNGSAGGVQETGTDRGAESGVKSQGTSKPATQKKGSAGRPNKILLAALIIAIIAVAVIVWSKGGSHSESGTETKIGTGGSGQQTRIINEDKEQEEPSSSGENDKKEESFDNATEPTLDETTESISEEDTETGKISRTSDDSMALSDTWEEIIGAVYDGTYKDRYQIGNTKELDMGTEGVITMKLVAMDEDDLADGSGKAPMTWVADEVLQSAHNMNSEKTNKGSWEASEMRAWLRETVLPLMPEEVRTNICEVTKYSYSYEYSMDAASKDTIWIPSVREVFPVGYDSYTDSHREKEGVSYTSVITDDESRKRSRDDETGIFWWWLRSTGTNTSDDFAVVNSYHASYNSYAFDEGGVVVGFCLGEVVESSDSVSVSRTSDAPMELTDTWEEIAAACREGTYKERYRIGDTKELDMGSEGIITMILVAMDKDELADGSGKAPMTWVADEFLHSAHNMNSEETCKGGWEASEMRAWLRETILPLMPEEVRINIREVTKYSYSVMVGKDMTSKDTIWIPSVREVFPPHYNDWTDERREKEGVSYISVFMDDESRMRSRDGESSASWWWLRSASYYYTIGFNVVESRSSDDRYSYSYYCGPTNAGGVIIGFCF